MSENEYWFCLKHHTVEGNDGCKNADRLGPYASSEEASSTTRSTSTAEMPSSVRGGRTASTPSTPSTCSTRSATTSSSVTQLPARAG